MVPHLTPTPVSLLARRLRDNPNGPLLTYYDDATGERVELSALSFDNWVAKTAGFLQDGLVLDPGAHVRLLLPPHWQTLVWAAAAWSVGAVVSTGDTQGEPDDDIAVAVAGPERLDEAQALGADDVVACSLRPLGGRMTDPLPDGVLDYAVEVPSYPDELVVVMPPEPADPAFTVAGVTQTLAGVVERARERSQILGAADGDRLLVATDDPVAAIRDAWVVPLALGGSAVLVRHEDETLRDGRVDQERVTLTL